MTLRPITVALVSALAASAAIADPPEYVIRDYGKPAGGGWQYFYPSRVNSQGIVCGVATGGWLKAPYLWRNGEFVALSLPPEFDSVSCTDINTAGDVVGAVGAPTIASTPVLWSKAGFQALPLPDGATRGIAHGINESGLIVGECLIGGAPVACQWSDGRVSTLPSLGYIDASAFGVSDSGTVVGLCASGDDQAALQWISDKGYLLGSPEPGHLAWSVAINDWGGIVGTWANQSQTQYRPYEWNLGLFTPMDLPVQYNSALCRTTARPGLHGGYALRGDLSATVGAIWVDGDMWDVNTLLQNGSGSFVREVRDIAGPGFMVADTDNDGDGQIEYAFIQPVGYGFVLNVDTLIAGQLGTFSVIGGNPNTRTYLAYSLRGRGNTFIAPLNVSLDLDTPIQAGNAKNTDATGATEWNLPIPANSRGRDVWFQAVQYGIKTNVFATWVN